MHYNESMGDVCAPVRVFVHMRVLDVYVHVPIFVFVAFWWVGREISSCICVCVHIKIRN